MITPPPSPGQTAMLLSISRGERPRIPPMMRRVLLKYHWITPREHAITSAGRRALATSPHRAEAERRLANGTEGKAWRGLTLIKETRPWPR